MRNQFVRLALVLMLISGLASAALALVNSFTAPIIDAAKAEALQQALTEVLPGAEDFREDAAFLKKEQEADREFSTVKAFYRATGSDGNPAGVVATVDAPGYGGPITAMVGVGSDGEVRAVRILSQSETPGLGTKVAGEGFLRAFSGAKAGETLAVNKDGGRIAAVAGATISSRAVTKAVNTALALAQRAGLGGVSP